MEVIELEVVGGVDGTRARSSRERRRAHETGEQATHAKREWRGRLEPAASGVTGRHQSLHNAADPGKSGSALSHRGPSDAHHGRVFRKILQVLASAGTFGSERPRTASTSWLS